MAAETSLRARREAVIRDHVAAENRHDPAGVAASFARPCYDVPAMGPAGQAVGAEAVQALLGGIWAAFPDWQAEPGPLHHADDAVFVEVRMAGTQQGPFAGLPPSGRRMDVRVGCLFEFEEDRLVCERVYFDFATVLQQLGALPAPAKR
jgi:steroid delta-isomerase-like uncharacterized protein